VNYGSGTHRLTTVGAASRTYDAAGSMSSDGTLTFTHDDRLRLVQVANGLGPVLQAGYNGQGQRVKKVGTGGTEWFVFGQDGEILGRYDSSGDLVQEFVWMGGRPVGVKQGTGMGIAYAGELLAVHSDQLGSPRAVVRPGGSPSHETVWIWDWKAGVFGDGSVDADPDADTVDLEVGLRFPGQWMDTETGLHYNYFRDYEPGTGRYVEPDPMGLWGGIGAYPYVDGNPLRRTDKFGLSYSDYVLCRIRERASGAMVGDFGCHNTDPPYPMPEPFGPDISPEVKCRRMCNFVVGFICGPIAGAATTGTLWSTGLIWTGCRLIVYGGCAAKCLPDTCS
jgi:RHS repeat-associated protein